MVEDNVGASKGRCGCTVQGGVGTGKSGPGERGWSMLGARRRSKKLVRCYGKKFALTRHEGRWSVENELMFYTGVGVGWMRTRTGRKQGWCLACQKVGKRSWCQHETEDSRHRQTP